MHFAHIHHACVVFLGNKRVGEKRREKLPDPRTAKLKKLFTVTVNV